MFCMGPMAKHNTNDLLSRISVWLSSIHVPRDFMIHSKNNHILKITNPNSNSNNDESTNDDEEVHDVSLLEEWIGQACEEILKRIDTGIINLPAGVSLGSRRCNHHISKIMDNGGVNIFLTILSIYYHYEFRRRFMLKKKSSGGTKSKRRKKDVIFSSLVPILFKIILKLIKPNPSRNPSKKNTLTNSELALYQISSWKYPPPKEEECNGVSNDIRSSTDNDIFIHSGFQGRNLTIIQVIYDMNDQNRSVQMSVCQDDGDEDDDFVEEEREYCDKDIRIDGRLILKEIEAYELRTSLQLIRDIRLAIKNDISINAIHIIKQHGVFQTSKNINHQGEEIFHDNHYPIFYKFLDLMLVNINDAKVQEKSMDTISLLFCTDESNITKRIQKDLHAFNQIQSEQDDTEKGEDERIPLRTPLLTTQMVTDYVCKTIVQSMTIHLNQPQIQWKACLAIRHFLCSNASCREKEDLKNHNDQDQASFSLLNDSLNNIQTSYISKRSRKIICDALMNTYRFYSTTPKQKQDDEEMKDHTSPSFSFMYYKYPVQHQALITISSLCARDEYCKAVLEECDTLPLPKLLHDIFCREKQQEEKHKHLDHISDSLVSLEQETAKMKDHKGAVNTIILPIYLRLIYSEKELKKLLLEFREKERSEVSVSTSITAYNNDHEEKESFRTSQNRNVGIYKSYPPTHGSVNNLFDEGEGGLI